MRPQLLAAIVLIVLGIAALAYQGIQYTSREKAVDLGPIQISAERTRTIPLPPIFGIAAIGGGIALLVLSRK